MGIERWENRYDFFPSKDFRPRPVISHTVIFTSEENRSTNQVASILNLNTYFIHV